MFSLIDPELSLIAKHKQEFYDIGVIPFISEYKIVEMYGAEILTVSTGTEICT